MSRHWGIHRIGHMIASPGIETSVGMDSWRVRAVPEPYWTFGFARLRAAWWVLTGRAHAVIWPEPGELECALDGEPRP